MDIQIIFLVALGVIFIVLLLLLVLVIKGGREKEADKLAHRLEYLERNLYEALRDLREEQNTLARASRMENLAASDMFREQIGKRLEDLHRNLGEIQNLAGGVDELKRILTNVKTRGIWGEMQLAKLLYDVLPKTRVAENVEVVPHSGERVEFALRLPGSDTLHEILLPIDAKFPQEDYLRLQQAREEGRSADAEEALKKLERRLKKEAKDISEKYICPPRSTDFGVMYLPSEGLYLEALNLPGLVEELQKTYRVCVAGPSTLAALVNSLQMGFRTLAVQERTDEVWRLLAAVKQDMENLAAVLDKTSKKLEETSASVGTANKKVHSISKRLQDVESGEDI